MKFIIHCIKSVLLGSLRLYKNIISPYLPGACRFYPTCSCYMHQAIDQHGIGYGLLLGIGRLCRCQPWGGQGIDCVPDLNGYPHTREKIQAIINYWCHGHKI